MILFWFTIKLPPKLVLRFRRFQKTRGTRWAIRRRHGPRAVAPRQWAVSTNWMKC